jgi:hypothetical protein
MHGWQRDVGRIVPGGQVCRVVLVAEFGQLLASLQTVGMDRRARLAVALDERKQHLRLHVLDDLDPRASEFPPLGLFAHTLALRSTAMARITLPSAPRPRLPPGEGRPEIALIHLDVAGELVAVAPWPDHRPAQLVQHQQADS